MKNTHLFPILFGMISFLFITSCEKADIQKTLITNANRIEPRNIDECEDCPVDDCCCEVEAIDNVNFFDLEICGTTTPGSTTTTCSGTFGACSISGVILQAPINGSGDSELFCMTSNTPFIIRSNQSGRVRITCQSGQVGFQSIDVTFPTNRAIIVNGGCEVGPCQ